MPALVVIGVAGCGKSSVAAAICQRTSALLIEGDAFHPEANILKMRNGIPLDDHDRQGWLEQLGRELQHAVAERHRAVLACSALKRRYRDTLRTALPGLGFLELTPDEAARRVAHRPNHFMPAVLVESQFHDLEPPTGEPGVLTVDASAALATIADEAVAWWQASHADAIVQRR